MSNFEIILLVLAALIIVLTLNNERSIREDYFEEYDVQNQYINELCDILFYAEIALKETVDDPEEREIIQEYIDDFHELIIEDCLRIEKCSMLEKNLKYVSR